MKIPKTQLRALIRECIAEMYNDIDGDIEISEASSLKSFVAYWQDKKGKEQKMKVKGRDANEAEMAALQKLRGRPTFYRFLFAKEINEETTTADVQGFDAPMSMKLVDLEDDE